MLFKNHRRKLMKKMKNKKFHRQINIFNQKKPKMKKISNKFQKNNN